MIISNPPWLVCNPIDPKDPGNYDPEGKIIKGLFNLTKTRLG